MDALAQRGGSIAMLNREQYAEPGMLLHSIDLRYRPNHLKQLFWLLLIILRLRKADCAVSGDERLGDAAVCVLLLARHQKFVLRLLADYLL
jgi:hypothetical protein